MKLFIVFYMTVSAGFLKKSILLNYISGKIKSVTQLKYFLTPFRCFFNMMVCAGFLKNLIFKIRFTTKILEKIKKKKNEKSRIILERWLRQ
jgi:hypothetical protein